MLSGLMRALSTAAVLVVLLVAPPASADSPENPKPARSAYGFEAVIETGVVGATRNDAGIPGNSGTRLSFVDDLSSSAAPFFRLRLGYRIAKRHLITALYAPLEVTAQGSVDKEVLFAGKSFAANSPLFAVYRFDSYRLTYRYSIVWRDNLDVAAGVTAKIRDAEIGLYGAQSATKTNTGFVPLLNLHVEWRPWSGAFGVVLDVDALAAPQGRAEDILLAATWNFHEAMQLRVGYRMVEGGSDGDEVYTFAWLHYGVVGLKLML